MSKYGRHIIFGLFVVTALFTLTVPYLRNVVTHEEPLVMGIFPRRHKQITEQLFYPMINEMSRQLNRRVNLAVAPNFKKFWEGVKKRKYDIVHFNQYHYMIAKKQYGYEVFAKNEEGGKSTITAAIAVRIDSGINSVADLKDRKILFGGGPKAMQSYIFARYLLEHEGGLQRDEYQAAFARNPPAAVVNTYYGLNSSAAAGVGDSAMRAAGKHININEMKVLIQGKQYAHLPWALRGGLDSKTKERIKHFMLNLNNSKKGKKLLRQAKLTGIHPADDTDFDPHRKIVKSVLGEDY